MKDLQHNLTSYAKYVDEVPAWPLFQETWADWKHQKQSGYTCVNVSDCEARKHASESTKEHHAILNGPT